MPDAKNEVLRALKERRSVRRYKADAVPQESLDAIIEAGLYAATGKNLQDVIIIDVTDKATIDRFRDSNRNIGGWDESVDPFYGAPALLIVLAEKAQKNRRYDGALAMGNMMLAAHALGLGSCWINRAYEEFETDEYKEWLREIGVEGEYEGIGHLIVGYPEGEIPAAAPRAGGRVYRVK